MFDIFEIVGENFRQTPEISSLFPYKVTQGRNFKFGNGGSHQ